MKKKVILLNLSRRTIQEKRRPANKLKRIKIGGGLYLRKTWDRKYGRKSFPGRKIQEVKKKSKGCKGEGTKKNQSVAMLRTN